MKNLANAILLLSFGAVGCAATAESPASPTNDGVVSGLYRADGTAPIQWLSVADASKYFMRRADGIEEGTYAFDAARTTVTFTSTTGRISSAPFSIVHTTSTTSAASISPRDIVDGNAGPIVSQTGAIVNQVDKLLVDGSVLVLAASGVVAHCPDGSRIPFPDQETANIALGDRCPNRRTYS